MSVSVAINPAMLHWAVERSGRAPRDFEKHFPQWGRWVEQAKQPTIRQVEQIAEFSHVPFGTLFLDEPLEPELPIADFRRDDASDRSAPSQDLLEVIETSQLRQDWYREYALANDVGEARVTMALPGASVHEAASAIVDDLRFTVI